MSYFTNEEIQLTLLVRDQYLTMNASAVLFYNQNKSNQFVIVVSLGRGCNPCHYYAVSVFGTDSQVF